MEKYGVPFDDVRLSDLEQGVDYDYTPGGVTAMLTPVVKRMFARGMIDEPNWVSLGPEAPSLVIMEEEKVRLYNVLLEPHRLAQYANFKEGIWNEIHGLGSLAFDPGDYEAYVSYNWACAKLMLGMLKDVDLFWVHDFQQLHIGNLIGPSAPAILRWHIPFNLENVSPRLRTLILKSIEGFDAMVVSTKRDLEGLIHAGYRGRAYAQYPYLDQATWNKVSKSAIETTKEKLMLGNDDRILLVVARMDPVKSQDVAIKAVARIRNKFPNLKLVLAGNGSFTGSGKGGLGHPKSSLWRSRLEDLIHDLKLEDKVILTGHLGHEELDALYSLADLVLVPSGAEGFNLTAVEGWLHRKPCLVSRGAGVSELVHDNVNGFVFNPGDENDLADKLELILKSTRLIGNLGANGSRMAEQCYVDRAIKSIYEVFSETSKTFSKNVLSA
jgi:glycosyltransferase involved in cell wall biosynthesis